MSSSIYPKEWNKTLYERKRTNTGLDIIFLDRACFYGSYPKTDAEIFGQSLHRRV